MPIIRDYAEYLYPDAKADCQSMGLQLQATQEEVEVEVEEGEIGAVGLPEDDSRIKKNAPGSEPGTHRPVGGIVGVILYPPQ